MLNFKRSYFSEFTEGAVVGITLGGVVIFGLLCAIIAFSAFLYYKRMCPCVNQQMFAPKPVEIHFNSYGKGPGARGAEAVSPWVSIMISNDKDKEVCLLFYTLAHYLHPPAYFPPYLAHPSADPSLSCDTTITPHTPIVAAIPYHHQCFLHTYNHTPRYTHPVVNSHRFNNKDLGLCAL